MEKQRVIVYIDGFNFYYGLKKDVRWKKYYWLDIVGLFEMFMRPNQELIAVKYFSARVDDIDQGMRQNAFFKQCLLPDIVHLTIPDYDLKIPPKWKSYQ